MPPMTMKVTVPTRRPRLAVHHAPKTDETWFPLHVSSIIVSLISPLNYLILPPVTYWTRTQLPHPHTPCHLTHASPRWRWPRTWSTSSLEPPTRLETGMEDTTMAKTTLTGTNRATQLPPPRQGQVPATAQERSVCATGRSHLLCCCLSKALCLATSHYCWSALRVSVRSVSADCCHLWMWVAAASSSPRACYTFYPKRWSYCENPSRTARTGVKWRARKRTRMAMARSMAMSTVSPWAPQWYCTLLFCFYFWKRCSSHTRTARRTWNPNPRRTTTNGRPHQPKKTTIWNRSGTAYWAKPFSPMYLSRCSSDCIRFLSRWRWVVRNDGARYSTCLSRFRRTAGRQRWRWARAMSGRRYPHWRIRC